MSVGEPKEEKTKILHQNDDQEKPVDTSNKENLKLYREIVDEKDTIFNTKKKKNDERKKKIEEARLQGKELEEKPMSNEDIYFSTRKSNFNSIRVL